MQFPKWGIGKMELWAHRGKAGGGGSSGPMFTGRPVCVRARGEIPVSCTTAPYKLPWSHKLELSLSGKFWTWVPFYWGHLTFQPLLYQGHKKRCWERKKNNRANMKTTANTFRKKKWSKYRCFLSGKILLLWITALQFHEKQGGIRRDSHHSTNFRECFVLKLSKHTNLLLIYAAVWRNATIWSHETLC